MGRPGKNPFEDPAMSKDYGKPGVRTHYHPNYYGAFILDPDGHDIEAVFHGSR